MEFQQLYSGSSANLYIVTANNGKRLMIECGVTWAKLQKALDFNLDGIVGCLVSHSHADHSKAAKDVAGAGIDVYASSGTIEATGITGHRVHAVENRMRIKLDTFQVLCFDTIHDASEPLGFVIRADDEYLLFVTDTFYIEQRFQNQFSIIAIEVSYDKDILTARVESGDVNKSLATRLLTSHQEKQAAMNYLANCCNLSKCRELHLLHMSRDNIDAEQTKEDFEMNFFVGVRTV